jgi:8-oxo-dGTP diphosphatase
MNKGGGPLIVVAACLFRQGSVLCCQRRPTDRHPGKWEFPGGKVEPGEDPRTALERELQEELATTAQVHREITRYQHTYPGRKPIELIFFWVTDFHPEPQNLQFASMQWVPLVQLPALDFLDGDVDFVRRMARGDFPQPG